MATLQMNPSRDEGDHGRLSNENEAINTPALETGALTKEFQVTTVGLFVGESGRNPHEDCRVRSRRDRGSMLPTAETLSEKASRSPVMSTVFIAHPIILFLAGLKKAVNVFATLG